MSSPPPSARRARRLRRRARLALWRWRHLVAAGALALAAGVVTDAMAPAPEPSEETVVLTTARPAGALLGGDDLTVRAVPSGLVPDGAVDDPEELIGARLAVALPSGFPIVDGVLVGPRLADGAPAGRVVVPVRLADADVAGLLGAGDRVDLLQAPSEGGAARVIARGALVMARTASEPVGTLGLEAAGAPLLLVAVTPDVATLLVGAGAWDPISAVLVADQGGQLNRHPPGISRERVRP